MEILGLVIILVAVAMWYGLFDSVERGARMADRRIAQYERDQKISLIKENANAEIDSEVVSKAKANMALIDSIDL